MRRGNLNIKSSGNLAFSALHIWLRIPFQLRFVSLAFEKLRLRELVLPRHFGPHRILNPKLASEVSKKASRASGPP